MNRSTRHLAILAFGSLVCSSLLMLAGSAAGQLQFSADITRNLSGTSVFDEDVVEWVDDSIGGFSDLGELPANVDIDGYEPDGPWQLFSIDRTATLSSGLVARPADVIRYDGESYSLAFLASSFGFSSALNVDAVGRTNDGLVISFDQTIRLPSGEFARDEDLILVEGGELTLFFDGSAAGLDRGLDIDAVSIGTAGAISLSLDQPGRVDGIDFDDDTVMRYANSSWLTDFEASRLHSAFTSADLVAVPEPAFWMLIASGIGLLSSGRVIRRSCA